MKKLLLLSVLLSGCYTTRIYTLPPSTKVGVIENEWQQTFLWGFISVGAVNAADICGAAGVAEVSTQIGGLGLLARWVTAGIWTPVLVEVRCGTAMEG